MVGFEVDCIVIGAGVIGLATARALARDGHEVVILEREARFGSQTSSRNSEVIHAGIYYSPGSLKARMCVEGRELLYSYCNRRNIAHYQCGKLIVATSQAQIAQLQAIEQAGRRNGVTNLEMIDGAQAGRLEPGLTSVAALVSPSTGIIDAHALMLSLLGEAERHGALITYGAAVNALRPSSSGIEIVIGADPGAALRSRVVVNSAGLQAHRIAASIEGFPPAHVPMVRYAKGSYFALAGRSPFRRLIYPVPEPGGLGIHMTNDLAGHARFGPDVEWIADIDHSIDPNRAAAFYPAIRSYWPSLGDAQLQPAFAGIRPKLSGPGEPPGDFCVSGPQDHGVAGIINLYGMESPGLTASLALAEHVAAMVESQT